MLAKKIANRPSANAAQDFGARIGYVCAKACAVDLANLAGGWTDVAFQMRCIAGLNPRLRSPVCHFVLSWADTEHPSDAEMIESAHRAVYELGGHEHQYVVAVHRDRPSPHVHVVLNRVHPVTGISLSLSHDYARLEKACRRIEHEMGWPRDRGHFDCEIIDGDVHLLPKPEEHWRRKRADRESGIRPDGRAVRGHERRTGLPALRDALPAETLAQIREKLDECKGWPDVHAALRPYGLRYVPHRSGARIARESSGWAMAASHLGTAYGLRQMLARLGEFVPARFVTPKVIEPLPGESGVQAWLENPLIARLAPLLRRIAEAQQALDRHRDMRRSAKREVDSRQTEEKRDLARVLGESRGIAAQALRAVLRKQHRDEIADWKADNPTQTARTLDTTRTLERLAPDLMLYRRYRRVLRWSAADMRVEDALERRMDHTALRQTWHLAAQRKSPDVPPAIMQLLDCNPGDIRAAESGDLIFALRDSADGITGFRQLPLSPGFADPARGYGDGGGLGLIGPRDAAACIIVADARAAVIQALISGDDPALIVILGDKLAPKDRLHLKMIAGNRPTFISLGPDPTRPHLRQSLTLLLPHARHRKHDPGDLWHTFVPRPVAEAASPNWDESPPRAEGGQME